MVPKNKRQPNSSVAGISSPPGDSRTGRKNQLFLRAQDFMCYTVIEFIKSRVRVWTDKFGLPALTLGLGQVDLQALCVRLESGWLLWSCRCLGLWLHGVRGMDLPCLHFAGHRGSVGFLTSHVPGQ